MANGVIIMVYWQHYKAAKDGFCNGRYCLDNPTPFKKGDMIYSDGQRNRYVGICEDLESRYQSFLGQRAEFRYPF